MKSKFINFLLILTSLIGYLEWGGNNQTFLFQAEADIVLKFFSEPQSLIHPFIVLPLLGQILLLITLFQKKPGKILTYFGIGTLGILLGFMFVIGIIGFNFKIIISTLPFILIAIYAIGNYRSFYTTSTQSE